MIRPYSLEFALKRSSEGSGNTKEGYISHDTDVLCNVIFRIKYLDGDEEDLFTNELTPHVRPDQL